MTFSPFPHFGRLALALALGLLVLFAAPWGPVGVARAQAPQPLLTILFTGNSEGRYLPCEVCGDTARGGLARRATALARVRGLMDGRVLVLGGGHEFTPLRAALAGDNVAQALAQAYAAMRYDLGLLSARDFEWLRAAEALPGPAWLPPARECRLRILEAGGLRVGVVLLPTLGDMYAPAPREAVDAVLRAAREARPQVDLLLGLGVWGWEADATLLAAEDVGFDALLSTGPGWGTGVRPAREGRLLVVRPEYQGWSVIRLDILALPGAGEARGWIDGTHYRATKIKLDAAMPEDRAVSIILAWL